jgi:hypothetical protein
MLNTATNAAKSLVHTSYPGIASGFAATRVKTLGELNISALQAFLCAGIAACSFSPKRSIEISSVVANARMQSANDDSKNDCRKSKAIHLFVCARYAATQSLIISGRKCARTSVGASVTGAMLKSGLSPMIKEIDRHGHARNAAKYFFLSMATSGERIAAESAANGLASGLTKKYRARLTMWHARDFVQCMVSRGG